MIVEHLIVLASWGKKALIFVWDFGPEFAFSFKKMFPALTLCERVYGGTIEQFCLTWEKNSFFQGKHPCI